MIVRPRISLLLLTVIWGCGDGGTGPEDTGDGSGLTDSNALVIGALVDAAIQSMEDAIFIGLTIGSVSELDEFSFAESNALFLEALALSPSDDAPFPTTALFGAAMTGIFLLEDNPAVRAIAEDWEAWDDDHEEPGPFPVATLLGPAVTAIGDRITLPLGFSTGTLERVANSGMAMLELARGPARLHIPPPSLEETQTVLEEVVRPALIQALAYLVGIDSDFTFAVTARMQGEDPIDADPLELDYTEVLTMQAGLEAALAAIDVATAYVVTPNPLDAQGFVDAMTPGSTFLTLAPEGASKLADALVRLKSTGNLLLSAIDELVAETDDQTDDIIKIDPSCCGGLTFESLDEVEDVRAFIQDFLDALSSPILIDEGGLDEQSFMLDARQFFINPIADLKTILPPYEVFTAEEVAETVEVFRWLALNQDEWTFPDPTFNGILPEISTTSDLLDTFEDVGGLFFDYSLVMGDYTLITVDGFDCRADAETGGLGCPVGSDFYYFGDIYVDGYARQSDVTIFLGGHSGPPNFIDASVFSNGSYVVVDNMNDTYTVNMDTRLQDGFGTPLVLTTTLTDMPGFTSIDMLFRRRGGSSITFSYLGSVWVFEKQY